MHKDIKKLNSLLLKERKIENKGEIYMILKICGTRKTSD